VTPAWVAALRRRADIAPSPTREPLALAGADAPFGSIERALAQRMVAAGLPLARGAAGAWRVADPGDASLDAVARWLDAERLASRWRGEALDVVDARGRVVARVERAAVRALGITTHAVHLVGRTPDGGWWVQQRARDKSVDPGLWDTLMGGLVGAGEVRADTLVRETAEEAGLDVAMLEELAEVDRITVRRPVPDGYMIEHIAVHAGIVPAGVVPVNRDGEVARFERLATAALVERLAHGAFTLEAALVLIGALEREGALGRVRTSATPGRSARS
jgi:8-oxo-dGTP pyrophosphatase MutT (NUDIX family)